MGLKTPKEKNPTRVVLVQQEYRALLRVSRQVDWRFHVALVLAHETGHRIGDIRKLRWSDIDFEGETVRWRAEHDKAGYEHRTPLTPEALSALEEARRENPESGDAPILPAPKDPSACMSSALAYGWWSRARPARGTGGEARPRLALAEAEVCFGLHGSAPQGALPARGLEDGQDGCSGAIREPTRIS